MSIWVINTGSGRSQGVQAGCERGLGRQPQRGAVQSPAREKIAIWPKTGNFSSKTADQRVIKYIS